VTLAAQKILPFRPCDSSRADSKRYSNFEQTEAKAVEGSQPQETLEDE
jgi:hypothetical protein